MKSDENLDRFFEPWNFPNEYGVPEVPMEDIEILEYLGKGKKSTTKKAKWNDRVVALKIWRGYSNDPAEPAYAFWELSCYQHLKAVQGHLIPELYFVSRSKKTGRMMFGIELGEDVEDDEKGVEEAMETLDANLKREGWRQRDGSFRPDNVLWMTNQDGTKRLVAIDLESFIPYFGTDVKEDVNSSKSPMAIFGLPEICPTELRLHGCDTYWEWCVSDSSKYYNTGTWRKQAVAVIRYDNPFLFRTEMERLDELRVSLGNLIPRALFLTRQRDGAILLGLEHFEDGYIFDTCTTELQDQLKSKIWSLGYVGGCSVGRVKVDDDVRPVLYNLVFLKKRALNVPEASVNDDLNDKSTFTRSGQSMNSSRITYFL